MGEEGPHIQPNTSVSPILFWTLHMGILDFLPQSPSWISLFQKGIKKQLFFSVLNNFPLSPSHCVHLEMLFANQPVLITGWEFCPRSAWGPLPFIWSPHPLNLAFLLIGTLSHPQFTIISLVLHHFFKDESRASPPGLNGRNTKFTIGQRLQRIQCCSVRLHNQLPYLVAAISSTSILLSLGWRSTSLS